jgi:hypothetical protein
VIKLLVGLLKGAVIGAGIGYGAYAIGLNLPWITYGVVGALVGFLAGRPIWSLIRDKNATSWIAILKAVFGFGVACGLYALLAKVWSPSAFMVTVDKPQDLFTWPVSVGGAIGAIYGAFIELDDAIGSDQPKELPAEKSAPKAAPKQLKKPG